MLAELAAANAAFSVIKNFVSNGKELSGCVKQISDFVFSKEELEKKATALLSKKAKKEVHPDYKPHKASGLTNKERRQIRRQGSKLVSHLRKGIEKSASHYQPKKV